MIGKGEQNNHKMKSWRQFNIGKNNIFLLSKNFQNYLSELFFRHDRLCLEMAGQVFESFTFLEETKVVIC